MTDLKSYLEIVAYIVAILAAVGSWWQYRRNSTRERARWLYDLYQRFYDNEEFQQMSDFIEHHETGFVGKDDRQLLPKLDQYLNFFQFVAILHKRHEIGSSEVTDMFRYPLQKIKEDQAVLGYLRTYGYKELDEFLKKLL